MEGDKIIKTLKNYSSSKPVDLEGTHSAIKVTSCLAEDIVVYIIYYSVSYRLYSILLRVPMLEDMNCSV